MYAARQSLLVMIEQTRAGFALPKTDGFKKSRVLLLPPVGGSPSSIHMSSKQAALISMVRVLCRQCYICRRVLIGLGVKIRPRYIHCRNLGPPLRLGIAHMRRHSVEVGRSHRQHTPERLERWRGSENSFFTSLTDLTRNQSRPDIWILVVAFVDVDPPHRNGRSTGHFPCLAESSLFPHLLGTEIF